MKNISVALSGSGFKFPAHVGALMAVRDQGYKVVELAATSGGAIVASLYASGMSLEVMQTICMGNDWTSMLEFNPLSVLELKGYCDGENLLHWLLAHTGYMTFSDLTMKLTIMASDLTEEAPFKFSNDMTPEVNLALAARASASIPFLYKPVVYKQAILVDGMLANNIPVDQLTVPDVPHVGIQLISNYTSLNPHSPLSMIQHMVSLTLSAADAGHVANALLKEAHVAFVETSYASVLDRDMSRDIRIHLLQDGYNAMHKLLEAL